MQAVGTVALQHFTAALVQSALALTACCWPGIAEVFLIEVGMECGVSLKPAQLSLHPVHPIALGEHQCVPALSFR